MQGGREGGREGGSLSEKREMQREGGREAVANRHLSSCFVWQGDPDLHCCCCVACIVWHRF